MSKTLRWLLKAQKTKQRALRRLALRLDAKIKTRLPPGTLPCHHERWNLAIERLRSTVEELKFDLLCIEKQIDTERLKKERIKL